MNSILLYLCTLLLALPSNLPSGKVIGISDGDTFKVLIDNKPLKVRVDAIDAPEKGMPYSKASKKFLSALCFNKTVTLHVIKTDRYGRTVARAILANGRDVSTEMVRAGYAWHYKKYSKDPQLARLEVLARQGKLGLWKDKAPMAPWEVRKMHRKGISTKKLFEGAPQ